MLEATERSTGYLAGVGRGWIEKAPVIMEFLGNKSRKITMIGVERKEDEGPAAMINHKLMSALRGFFVVARSRQQDFVFVLLLFVLLAFVNEIQFSAKM